MQFDLNNDGIKNIMAKSDKDIFVPIKLAKSVNTTFIKLEKLAI